MMAETPTVIPDAGVYGAQTAAATNAYNNAIAQATAQRNALYGQYGLNTQGAVDPNNPQGQYQQMLRSQADRYQADEEDAASRGLGRSGLANQQEGHDINDSLAQDFQFQNQVAGVGSDYQSALQDALSQKQGAISDAYNNALSVALQKQIDAMNSGDYTAPGTGSTLTEIPPKGGQMQSAHAQKVAQQHHAQNHQKIRRLHPPRKGRH